jgi:hypothetical protein
MGKHLTREEYIEQLATIDPNIILTGEFLGKTKKTEHLCKIHNFKWFTYPKTVLLGHGCPKCAGNMRLTHEEFINKIYAINKNIEILGQYVNANTNIMCRCKIDGHEWSASPKVLSRGGGCPVCGFQKIGQALRKTHDKYVEEVSRLHPTLRVIGTYYKDGEDVLHKCSICSSEWLCVPSRILQGQGCPVCSGRRIGGPPEYYNSIWASKHRDFFSKYMTEEQMKSIMPYSTKTITVICPDCGRLKNIKPDQVTSSHTIRCPCGDGMSYPNKFMFNLLEQLKIDFIPEYTDVWSERCRYDDFIPNIKCIIENHGRQHYEEVAFTERTLTEEKTNDEKKMELALANGVQKYIIIDCRHANANWIKKSIMNSDLPRILGFSETDINWDQCDIFAHKNLAKEICEYYKAHSNMLIQDIAKHFNLSRSTIRKYLAIGNKYGWCNYSTQNSYKTKGKALSGRNNPSAAKVYCIDNGRVFECQKDAIKLLNLSAISHIPDCCSGKRKSAGGYRWKYLYDQTRKDGTIIPGAITLGLITEEEALAQLNSSDFLQKPY